MRYVLLAAPIVAALMLASCGKTNEAAKTAMAENEPASADVAAAETPAAAASVAEESLPDAYPTGSVDFKGVYDLKFKDRDATMTMWSSGQSQRIAFSAGADPNAPNETFTQIMVNTKADDRMLMWREGEGAPTKAMSMSRSEMGDVAAAFGADDASKAAARKVGEDTVIGERCTVFAMTTPDGESRACVTRDGILLRTEKNGKTVMEATSITRGAQDPALFAPPAGYEIVDLSECMKLSAEMMTAMRARDSGALKALQGKMEACRGLGE